MRRLFHFFLGMSLLGTLMVSGCRKKCEDCDYGSLEMQVVHKVDGEAFQPEPKLYTKAEGEVFRVKDLLYYLGNFTLTSSSGKEYKLSGPRYYLVDASNAGSLKLDFDSVPVGDYVHFRFTLGVDAVSNSSSANEGSLDPNNNNKMFWPWNTSYVFMRIVGNYASFGADPDKPFSLDMGLDINLVNVSIPVSFKMRTAPEKLNLEFDLAEIFKGPYSYGFDKDKSSLHGDGAAQQNYGNKLAVNMRDAFKVVTP